jgi:hypothetical protein
MKPISHIVVRRPFDNDPDRDEEPRWEKVGFTTSFAAAIGLARSPVSEDGDALNVAHGDLLLALPIDFINPLLMQQNAHSLFVVKKDGSVAAAPKTKPPSPTWLSFWEGPDGVSLDMIGSASRAPVDVSRIVLSAVECFRYGASAIAAIDKRPAHAADIAAAWAIGLNISAHSLEAGVGQAAAAERDLRSATTRCFKSIYSAACAVQIANIALHAGDDFGPFATNAVSYASASIDGGVRRWRDPVQPHKETAPLVRKWIPLSVLLLGYLGESVPLGDAAKAWKP